MFQKEKAVIVTGSSRGIGRAIAIKMAGAGFSVVVNYASNEGEAAKVVAEIVKAGGKAIAVQADVSKSADCERLFDASEKNFGGVDVIVNNAGVMTIRPIGEMDDATFDHMMNINVKGTFNMMRLAAKHVRDGGRVINFSSSALILAFPGYAVYNATKAAVEAMTKVFAKELGTRKITVNAVAPGPVATELFFAGKSEELVKRLVANIPLGRLGEVEDIAPLVAFLASSEGGWVNAQTVRANGGVG
jgi:3-oxoacyl-[acyl-carrier protein] reductase